MTRTAINAVESPFCLTLYVPHPGYADHRDEGETYK